MKKKLVPILGATLAAGLGLTMGQTAVATPTQDQNQGAASVSGEPRPVAQDELPNPLEDKRRALREEAVSQVLNGEATPAEARHEHRRQAGRRVRPWGPGQGPQARGVRRGGQAVHRPRLRDPRGVRQRAAPELPRPGHRPGDARPGAVQRSAAQPDPRARPRGGQLHGLAAGLQPRPLREHVLRRGRSAESLKTYYEKQSSGRFSVDGTVTDWVRVRYNEARYGRSNGFPCGGNVCTNTWDLVRDAANQWYDDQIAAGRTPAAGQRRAGDLRQVGPLRLRRRRQLQRVRRLHRPLPDRPRRRRPGRRRPVAGRGRDLEPPLVRLPGHHAPGPPGNLRGGTQIGNTGLWIGDYTIQPENGGRSVFFHEFGHDLGLPDDYNVHLRWRQQQRALDPDGPEPARRQGRGSSSATAPATSVRGTSCSSAGSTTRRSSLVQGWAATGRSSSARRSTTPRTPRRAVVVLPKKEVVTELGAPAAGTKQWYSGAGDELENTMTRQVTLPADPATLSFQARWDIEDCGPDPCDYAYVEVSTDGSTLDGDPGLDHQAGRGQRDRRHAGGVHAGHVRPVGVRGPDDRPAVPLLHRRRGRRATMATCRTASSSTRSRSPLAATRCSPTAPRPAPTAGPLDGWTVGGAELARSTTTTTSRVTGRTCRTTSTSSRVRTTSGTSTPSRTSSTTTRTSRVCWSPTGTRRTPTTTRSPTRAPVGTCTSTRTRCRSTGSTASPGVPASRSTTRRSA